MQWGCGREPRDIICLRVGLNRVDLSVRNLTRSRTQPYPAPVELRGKKLGILISCRPEEPGFRHGLRLAESAMRAGVNVYLYCIDEAVYGVTDAELQTLKNKGLNLYACAYGAQRRNLPMSTDATFAGLTVVNDIIASTDRFVSFN